MCLMSLGALMTVCAWADPLLDFNMNAIHPAGASISYAGGANPLVGVNIGEDDVTGIDTPLNSGVTLPCPAPDCILSFTTGNLTGSDANNWFFGGGGTIDVVFDSTTVLSGTFNSASVAAVGGDFKVLIADFIDWKQPELLAYYGLPEVPYHGGMNLSFTAPGSPGDAFTSTLVLSGDLVNTPVPEPSSILLLGTALLGAATLLRRRLTQR
jgi:hypothetical protein